MFRNWPAEFEMSYYQEAGERISSVILRQPADFFGKGGPAEFHDNKGMDGLNSSGWARAMMSQRYSEHQFLKVVVNIFSREFEMEVKLMWKAEETFLSGVESKAALIKMGEYAAELDGKLVAELQARSPYSLDRYILERFCEQGFSFDRKRSQYIRHVFGVFYKEELL